MYSAEMTSKSCASEHDLHKYTSRGNAFSSEIWLGLIKLLDGGCAPRDKNFINFFFPQYLQEEFFFAKIFCFDFIYLAYQLIVFSKPSSRKIFGSKPSFFIFRTSGHLLCGLPFDNRPGIIFIFIP